MLFSKKRLAILFLPILMLCLGTAYIRWQKLSHFKQNNLFYYWLMPEVIKSLPELSQDYYFSYNGNADRAEHQFAKTYCQIKDIPQALELLKKYAQQHQLEFSLGKVNSSFMVEIQNNHCLKISYEKFEI